MNLGSSQGGFVTLKKERFLFVFRERSSLSLEVNTKLIYLLLYNDERVGNNNKGSLDTKKTPWKYSQLTVMFYSDKTFPF